MNHYQTYNEGTASIKDRIAQPKVPEGYKVEHGSAAYKEILVTAPDGGQQIFWPDDAAYGIMEAMLSAQEK